MSRTTRRNSWMLGIGLATLFAVGVAAAEGRGGHQMREMFSRLDLSDEQKAGIQEIVKGQRPVVEPLAEQAAAARKALFEAVHASSVDEGSIRLASDRLAQARLALAIERARTISRVRELLRPEQIQKLEAARDERLARMEQRGRHPRGKVTF